MILIITAKNGFIFSVSGGKVDTKKKFFFFSREYIYAISGGGRGVFNNYADFMGVKIEPD